MAVFLIVYGLACSKGGWYFPSAHEAGLHCPLLDILIIRHTKTLFISNLNILTSIYHSIKKPKLDLISLDYYLLLLGWLINHNISFKYLFLLEQ